MQETTDPNTLRILFATDIHLGYKDRDNEREDDSLTTFEEILDHAVKNDVDFILLGGDLFHDNKPSRRVLYKTIELLRRKCLGDRPLGFEILSDQGTNFSNGMFNYANFEDNNYSIAMPIFSIHGNHDDPVGQGNLCSLDLLSVSNLINYFGKIKDIDQISVSPILIEKGETRLALYGIGNIADERLFKTFQSRQVELIRPTEDTDEWFNMFVIHQNRVKRGPTNYIPEEFLSSFIDLVLWGHEHDCLIDPVRSGNMYITQPGSTVATSLSDGEALRKHVGILEIKHREFYIEKIPLKSVRPFVINAVNLSTAPKLNLTDKEAVVKFLVREVEKLITQSKTDFPIDSNDEWSRKRPKKPLIRLKVDYEGDFTPFNIARFGQQFATRVANYKEILLFHRKRPQAIRLDALRRQQQQQQQASQLGRPNINNRSMLNGLDGSLIGAGDINGEDMNINDDGDNVNVYSNDYDDLGEEITVESILDRVLTDSKFKLKVLKTKTLLQSLMIFVDKDDNTSFKNYVDTECNRWRAFTTEVQECCNNEAIDEDEFDNGWNNVVPLDFDAIYHGYSQSQPPVSISKTPTTETNKKPRAPTKRKKQDSDFDNDNESNMYLTTPTTRSARYKK